jgi:hypothetical protein
MSKKESISQISFLTDAIQWKFKNLDEARLASDNYPLSFIDKAKILVNHLTKIESTKELIQAYSSFNYGSELLHKVFPRNENPTDYSSSEFEIVLDEHPIQVWGAKEYEDHIEAGIQSGLSREYILWGFQKTASQRGINLEWHFHAQVPNKPNTLFSPQERE